MGEHRCYHVAALGGTRRTTVSDRAMTVTVTRRPVARRLVEAHIAPDGPHRFRPPSNEAWPRASRAWQEAVGRADTEAVAVLVPETSSAHFVVCVCVCVYLAEGESRIGNTRARERERRAAIAGTSTLRSCVGPWAAHVAIICAASGTRAAISTSRTSNIVSSRSAWDIESDAGDIQEQAEPREEVGEDRDPRPRGDLDRFYLSECGSDSGGVSAALRKRLVHNSERTHELPATEIDMSAMKVEQEVAEAVLVSDEDLDLESDEAVTPEAKKLRESKSTMLTPMKTTAEDCDDADLNTLMLANFKISHEQMSHVTASLNSLGQILNDHSKELVQLMGRGVKKIVTEENKTILARTEMLENRTSAPGVPGSTVPPLHLVLRLRAPDPQDTQDQQAARAHHRPVRLQHIRGQLGEQRHGHVAGHLHPGFGGQLRTPPPSSSRPLEVQLDRQRVPEPPHPEEDEVED